MNIGFRSYISPSTHISNSGKNAKTDQREEIRLILKSPSQKQSTNRKKKRMTMNEWSSQRYNTTSFHSKPPELHDLLLGASPIITKKENQRKKKKKKPKTKKKYFPTKKKKKKKKNRK